MGFRLGLLVCLVCVWGEKKDRRRWRRNRIAENAKQAMVDVRMAAVPVSESYRQVRRSMLIDEQRSPLNKALEAEGGGYRET